MTARRGRSKQDKTEGGRERGMRRQDAVRWVAETVEDILQQRGDGLELVEVTFRTEGPRLILRVTLDGPDGITLEHCQQVSRALSARLDEEDPIPQRYYLEVSSPGLDRPLVKEKDYVRFAGREVRLSTYAPLDGRRNFQGKLVKLEDGHVHLVVDGKPVAIPFEGVARCRLVPQF